MNFNLDNAPKEAQIAEKQLFEDTFKNMPLEQFKLTAIEAITSKQDYEGLSKIMSGLFLIAQMNK